MILTTRQQSPAVPFDKADIAKLIISIYACVDAKGDSLVMQNLDEVYDVAVSAAQDLHELAPEQGERWDGCVWLEWLEQTDEVSLAGRLARLIHQGMDETRPVVAAWLDSKFDLPPADAVFFNVEHEGLYYDSDSICQWDNEFGWFFLYYHRMANPTVESVLQVLANNGWQPTYADDDAE